MAQSVDTIERTHKSRLKSFFESEIMDIVYQYFETKVLANSNLFFFLSDHKHILFHLYKPKEKCCACQSEPADKKTSVEQCIDSTLKEKQFRILFNVDNNSQTNHEVKENGRIRMHCLCIYDPKSEGDLDVTHMDICLICTLVRTCCKQNPAVNPTWLENIKEVRNIIYHSGTSDSLTKDKAEEKWGILENSAIEIAKTMGVSYIKSFKSRVLNLNAKFSFKDEMNRTLEERDANLERTLAERDANLERTLVERDAKLDRTFDEKIADLIERIKTEIKEHTICVEEKVCLQVNNTGLVSTTTEDAEGESSISGQVSNDRRYVVWKFRSRGEWDVEKVRRKLESFAIIADFDVEFQYFGSLVIVTSTLTWFLTNEFVFKSAVKRFLTLFGKLIAKEEAASEKLLYIDVDIEVCYKKPPRYTEKTESSEQVVPDFPDDRKVLQNSGLLQSDFEMEGLQEKEEDESFLKSTERESYSKNFDILDNMIHMIEQRKLVAAVHIGTTYSGFAYCKRIAYDNNETPEIVTHKWITDIYITENTPTCVLFKPSRTLHSFGYDAIRHYQENPDEEDFMDWYYFENLDMMLDKAGEYTAESDLLESNGSRDSKKTRMKAVDVLSAVIEFMKGQLLKDRQNTYVIPITDEEIQWVIAIPAIWDIRARELTEMAAFKAGIRQDQILLALEPEAASLFCKRFPGDLNRSTVMDRMKIGSKYIVLILDQEGRPTGIGVYEITGLHSSREIHQTGLDHLGKTTVIAEFQNFLEHLLGKEFVHHMKMLDPPSYFSVFNEFKQAMTRCSFEEERAKTTIRLPVSWLTKYKDWHRMEMKKRLKQSVYSDEAGIRKDKLTMKIGLFRRFYDPLINSVSKEIQNILKEISGVNTLFLVGNPSTSAVLSDSLKTVFEDVLIVVPKEPACALLKGAVMYGFDPPSIKRISNKKSNRHVEANEERMQAEELQFIGNIRLLLNSFCEMPGGYIGQEIQLRKTNTDQTKMNKCSII